MKKMVLGDRTIANQIPQHIGGSLIQQKVGYGSKVMIRTQGTNAGQEGPMGQFGKKTNQHLTVTGKKDVYILRVELLVAGSI